MAMAAHRRSLVGLLLLACLVASSAQFGGKKKDKPKAPAIKTDIPFIRCQVCDFMAKQMLAIVKDLNANANGKRVKEADILDKIEKMCDPDTDEGDWISSIDIVEKGKELKLVDTGKVGKCKSECRTIARVCEQLHEDIDTTDLSAMLIKGEKRSPVLNFMCYESTDACSKKAPPVPKDRKAGEEHVPIAEDELKAMRMMRSMKAAGLSGSLYDRDSIADEMAEMTDQYGDDPDFANMMAGSGMGGMGGMGGGGMGMDMPEGMGMPDGGEL